MTASFLHVARRPEGIDDLDELFVRDFAASIPAERSRQFSHAEPEFDVRLAHVASTFLRISHQPIR